MRKLILISLFFTFSAFGQNTIPAPFTYAEFLGSVKKFHPLVKRANLEISMAEANLMKARGSFDPKIEVDFTKKQFKNNEYYSLLNSSFKIPTWYGVEVKAGFDNNEGIYLNPENTLPNQGLTSVGITVPLGQGLLINQRMADLRKAKMQLELSRAERKLNAIAVLYDASLAYFSWKRCYDEVVLYEKYTANAQNRFKGIQALIEQGDKPAIDSIEARIIVKNRLLSLEDSRLKLAKAKLELANFLWLENSIPLELAEAISPEDQLTATIEETLETNELLNADFNILNHPKIAVLQSKMNMLDVERKLKANNLLPKIDLGYSYLSEPATFDHYNYENYKIGVNCYFPLFLRKERGDLKLTKLKIQESQFTLASEKLQLSNKINAQKTEQQSLRKQQQFIRGLVTDHQLMLSSEERLFSFGESSLFVLNSRENNLLVTQLAAIVLENRFFVSSIELFKNMANADL